jgi:hypothetical protein
MKTPRQSLDGKIKHLANKFKRSETEITELLNQHFEMILGEQDFDSIQTDDNGESEFVPTEQLLKEHTDERKQVLLQTQLLNQNIQELKSQLQERKSILASLAYVILKQKGLNPNLPEGKNETELRQEFGVITPTGNIHPGEKEALEDKEELPITPPDFDGEQLPALDAEETIRPKPLVQS